MSVTGIWPALEPLAGAGLAINLAYLALDRFRVIERMARHADELIGQINQQHKNESGQVEPLLMLVGEVRTLHRMREHLKAYAILKKVQLPPPLAGTEAQHECEKCYNRWFASKVDQIWSLGFVATSLAILLVGVCSNIWDWKMPKYPGDDWVAGLLLVQCLAAMAVPARFTLLGTKVRKHTIEMVGSVEENLGVVMVQIGKTKAEAAAAALKSNGTGSGTGTDSHAGSANVPVVTHGVTRNP